MGKQETRVEVEIFGEYYILKGNEPEEYLRMLAQYVNKKIRQVITRNPRLGLSKAALLTALNIADELMKLQKEYDELAELLEMDRKAK
ncbi:MULTISPECIES: cell division protein ZapA [Desulfofundulus]|jgi:cell division protein ZapA|uniref:Cell division protein ZapA n=1 Tax=Desulfofundulus australicus DSM 11792 TaxID=1121425 RepID=A0A1M5BYQ1_9FIRM|nr:MULTISPECIES: cell division protein ZapA [Desulfofundulus]MCS5695540.1 cell division protein ZapA [Desulfofundulus thermocisternus]MDK2888250.1 cell division protein ZapA [Thermoanaerobacter sp.]SHF47520.1 cell division protein ZapA [Desulfofundulus australicus DSM 11792]